TWCVVETPDEQAAQALQTLDAWTAQDAARGSGGPDVVCGVPDESVAPFLERRLAERGVVARRGTAGLFRDSPAGTLLAALHDLLAEGSFSALATLARHPAAHAALARHAGLAGRDPLALLDAAQAGHLPGRVCGPLAPRTAWPTLAPVLDATHALLGELLVGTARPWSAWVAPIAEALGALFGDATLVPEAPDSHATHASLGIVAEALAELAALPAATGADPARGDVEARDALALLLRACAAEEVPPRADSAAVDLLGWLELPLDEAPDVLLAGFNSGSLPAPPASARWLPEDLRRALRVPGETERRARDACLLAQLLHGRRRVALLSGRVDGERNPLLPSPLAFQLPDDGIPAQVRTWLPAHAAAQAMRPAPAPASIPATAACSMTAPATTPAAATGAPGMTLTTLAPARALPRLSSLAPLRSISVTGFRAYLDSPYRFYLQRVLRLQRAEDDARELDPQGFGTLAHDVLQGFGQGPARHSGDEEVVRHSLHAALDGMSLARFGPQPLPAVAIQVEQLRYRLERFARWQARSTQDGWRIAAAEWTPQDPVTLDAGGTAVTLRGRIDRIDVHADGRRWRVLDYKTGDEVRDPDKAHRAADGTWRDLQLPLYALLVRRFAVERGLEEPPELGYLALPRDEEAECARLVTWDEADIEDALDRARQILEQIVAGEFFGDVEGSLGDPILDAIAGRGLLESAEDAARAAAAGARETAGSGQGEGQ
ncbi:MAG TPA: PD-(D/E)XK nuclease family protein, partial [Planctomycetota bacterium]|nr:PD-(D/E)XK nuclease family protein [Planctomycetota bacterium]